MRAHNATNFVAIHETHENQRRIAHVAPSPSAASASAKESALDSTVIARRKRAVRSQHQGRAVCGHFLREKQRCFLVTFCHRTKSYPLSAGQRKPFLRKLDSN